MVWRKVLVTGGPDAIGGDDSGLGRPRLHIDDAAKIFVNTSPDISKNGRAAVWTEAIRYFRLLFYPRFESATYWEIRMALLRKKIKTVPFRTEDGKLKYKLQRDDKK